MQENNPVPQSLQNDLKFYRDAIKEVARETLERKVSSYPVFVAHQHEVSLGEVILDKAELGREWTINVSVVEELEEKGLIQKEKAEAFKKTFKDPADYVCVLMIDERGGNFIFLPMDGALLGDKSNNSEKEE